MPLLSDYEELDLSALEIDGYQFNGNRIRAVFGDGYSESATNGHANGLWNWSLSSTVVVDDEDYNDQINGVPSFAYYYDFIKRHTTGDQDVFVIEWRGHKYLAEFTDNGFGGEMHTVDLFSMDGVEIRQRRVAGFLERGDGSVFEQDQIADYIWGRYNAAEDFPTTYPGPSDPTWANSGYDPATETSQTNGLTNPGGTDVVSVADVLGTNDAVRFSSTTNDGVLIADTPTVTVYDAFFVMQMREATFSNYAGIFTADATIAALIGNSGTANFFNIGFSDDEYSYRKNDVSYAQSAQAAPMNEFGVVHIRFESGLVVPNPQFGKDRNFSGRFAEMDQVDMTICDQPMDLDTARTYARSLMTQYGIS
jgi:hypothetical protein